MAARLVQPTTTININPQYSTILSQQEIKQQEAMRSRPFSFFLNPQRPGGGGSQLT